MTEQELFIAEIKQTIDIARKDRYVNTDVLYTLDDITPKKYPTVDSLLIVQGNGVHEHIPAKFISKLNSNRINRLFAGFDFRKHHMVVAGGAVLIRSVRAQCVKDYDIFFYGHSKESAVDAIMNCIAHLKARGARLCIMTCTSNCVTFRIAHGEEVVIIQFIFRLYNTMAEIIQGFDLGSCSYLWDGEKVWTTKMGQFAYKYGLNIIDLEVRRPSYEFRLMKYCDKNFGVIMPNFDISQLEHKHMLYKNLELSKCKYDDAHWSLHYRVHPVRSFEYSDVQDPVWSDRTIHNILSPNLLVFDMSIENMSITDMRNTMMRHRITIPPTFDLEVELNNKHAISLILALLPDIESDTLTKIGELISNKLSGEAMCILIDCGIEEVINKWEAEYRIKFKSVTDGTALIGVGAYCYVPPETWYGKYYKPF